jgi:hypothetical protein
VGRGTRLAGDSGVLPVTRSEGSDGVLLVRPRQSLAPDLEIEESNSELGQKRETVSRPRGIGIAGRREATRMLRAAERLRDQSRAEWQGRAVIGLVPVSRQAHPDSAGCAPHRKPAHDGAGVGSRGGGLVVAHASAGSPASAQVVGQGGRRGHAWVTISSAPWGLACHWASCADPPAECVTPGRRAMSLREAASVPTVRSSTTPGSW